MGEQEKNSSEIVTRDLNWCLQDKIDVYTDKNLIYIRKTDANLRQ